jgi:hypothetical protein
MGVVQKTAACHSLLREEGGGEESSHQKRETATITSSIKEVAGETLHP